MQKPHEHWPCRNQQLTGQPVGTKNYRDDFIDEIFTCTGFAIDAPRTLPRGGMENFESQVTENLTFGFSFVMRGGE